MIWGESFLSNETILGTSVVKEAVRFYDPVSNKPEKIPITEELKKQVRSLSRDKARHGKS